MRYLSNFEGGAGSPAGQIKEEKLKRLFDLLYSGGEMARADLARATGLSPTTISALVEELIRKGLVVETGYASTAQGGRKPINLRIHAEGRQIPTFALAGDELHYALYNLGMEVVEALDVNLRGEEAVRADQSFAALIQDVLLRRSKRFRREIAAGVCICAPGSWGPDRQAPEAEDAELRMGDFAALERELRLPLFFGSETQGLAYAEVIGRGATGSLIYANVSKRVDACIYAGGDICPGIDSCAGQLGHISINHRGRTCSCGGRGCLERYVSTPAVLERVAQAAAFKPCRMLNRMTGGDENNLTLKMIGLAYDAGEAAAREAIEDVAEQLFTGIHSMVCATGVSHVVLGGDIVQLGAGFLERMRLLARRVGGNHLPNGIHFDFSRVRDISPGAGIVKYFIDKRFEINRGGD